MQKTSPEILASVSRSSDGGHRRVISHPRQRVYGTATPSFLLRRNTPRNQTTTAQAVTTYFLGAAEVKGGLPALRQDSEPDSSEPSRCPPGFTP